MALPIRIARAIVGAIVETTPGTFLEPTACFHAENISINPSSTFYDQNPTRNHFGRLDSIPAGAEVEIGFEIIASSTGAGTAPYWDVAMMACGHQKITAAGTSITYKPSTVFTGAGTTTLQPSEGYTVAVWDEGPGGGSTGPRYAAVGCQGEWSFSTKMGEGLRLKFSFKGAYSTTTDDASLPAVVDTASLPPTFLGAQLTVHANAALAYEGFDFSKGNVLSKRIDAAAQNGLKGYWITAHKPMIKVNPEMVLIGTFDAYTKWRAGTTGNFQTAVLGVTAGNRFQLICGRTQISDIGHGEREGARTYDLSLNVSTAANAVDGDDYSLVIT